MNERIKQISDEVWEWSESQTYDGMDEFSVIWEAEFARRIIEECATIARNYTLEKSGVSTDYTGIVYVENAIKDHFGVKQ